VRALVAGAGGQLGRALQDCAPAGVTVIAPSEAEFDITDAATVARVIADSRVDVVFNAAAYTAVDKAEADAAPAQLINADAVALLAAYAPRLVHVSTDFVFDGAASRPYLPDATPNPISAYGATKLAGEHRARLGTLESQIADLTARYPEGIEPAKTAAQLAFAQAEARVTATKADLPPDFDKLPERNKRAAAALQQLTDALRAGRTERDQAKGILETLGGQGLYSRETELEEKKTETLLRRDAARTQGWCTRIAQDLIEHRKQAATKAVLTPLESRLTTAFAALTGVTDREVFLDENLQIAGIGRTRDSAHAFESLSQGAKEQLLLCLRLAVAQELATDEPQVLILDDVLVNTDPFRQERILDVLGAQAERLQILILTCHPDRYRGVGQPLALTV
jgi:dTDP-4-dehydrorhamnose reductase